MKSYLAPVLGFVFLSLLLSCSPKPRVRVVLLEDARGKAGAVSVSTPGGTQVVDRGGYAVDLYGPGKAPGKPFAADREEIRKTFGKVMEAVPPEPAIHTLYFEFGRRTLLLESLGELPGIVAAIRNRPLPVISIVGHTDRSGDKERNNRLALARARAVREHLVALGIPGGYIVEVTSHGENNPAVMTPDGQKERRNRRVEIIIR